MKKFTKSVVALLMTTCMLFGLTACGNGNTTNTTPTPVPTQATEPGGNDTTPTPEPTKAPEPTKSEEPKEIVTIRYGTHWVNGLDPHYTDEVTGEYVMAADQREARYAAEAAILEEYGVVFEYVGFGDTLQVLLQSVMANDPVCDIAVVWGGAEDDILAQNVLQKLDDYAYIFEDPEYSWMFLDKLYGGHYYLTDIVRFSQRWPLIYNIDLIEEAGLENPSVTFANGNWTWSTFKDLLTKLEAFYANDDTISAYLTDHRFSVLSSIYTAGGAIYGNNGLSVTSDATKKGVAYIKELIDAGLLTEKGVEFGSDGDPDWTANCETFRLGGSCFTDHADWLIGWSGGTAASERDESIGIVPWPRPDDMPLDSEDYRQVITLGDSVAIPKGVDAETTELALKAFALYTKTYLTTLAGVDSMAEYKENYIEQQAVTFNIDIFHEEYGDAILESFAYITDQMENGSDYADMLGFRGKFDELVSKSLYGIDGVASYDVAIEANLSMFSETEEEMKALLSSGKLNDTIAPVVSAIQDPVPVPVGTKMTDPIWGEYIQGNDSIEGLLPMENFQPVFTSNDTSHTDAVNGPIYDAKVKRVHSEADLNTPGTYNRMFRAYFVDSFGNRGYKTMSVIVYDPTNTEKPTVELHSAPMYINVGTDVNTITWIGTEYNSVIKTATDADGLDLSANVRADLSTLDSSAQGTYEVKITVTDYAGNSTVVTGTVIVE